MDSNILSLYVKAINIKKYTIADQLRESLTIVYLTKEKKDSIDLLTIKTDLSKQNNVHALKFYFLQLSIRGDFMNNDIVMYNALISILFFPSHALGKFWT